jgi:hypothetical protein
MNIYEDHLKDLEASTITYETAVAAGLYSLTAAELVNKFGIDLPTNTTGLGFPYNNNGKYRAKLFPPLKTKKGEIRYLQPKGTPAWIYFPPGAKEVLNDTSVDLTCTEGEKKILAIMQLGKKGFATGGLWNFLKDGKPIDDLNLINFFGRKITFVPDSDVWSRPDLLKAVYAFCYELERRGASVSIVQLPSIDGAKVGLDDFLLKHSLEDFEKLERITLKHSGFNGIRIWHKPWLKKQSEKAKTEKPPESKEYEDHIAFLNKRHAVITINGRTQILNEEIDPLFNRETISFSTLKDVQLKYANKLIPNPNPGLRGPKYINIVTDWIKSSDRREYNNIIFSPGCNIKGSYNLWKGFSVEPRQGNWELFQDHLLQNVSNKKQNIYDWIMTWLAKIVQDPGGKRSQTSLIFRGSQGVGKGVFVSAFGKLLGDHYLQISNPVQLTGRFNNHFQNVILLFVDEGHWAGDKAGEGIIKGIITEPTLTIEPKGKDVFRIQNHINLVMASNNDWIVPAGLDERRFMVLDVADYKKQDRNYFGAIAKQLLNGGYEAMLYDLLEWDISKVDVSTIINTAACFDQKIATMNPIQKFWFETLRSGHLGEQEDYWSEEIKTIELYEQYLKFCNNLGVRYREIDRTFGKSIKKLCPKIEKRYPTLDIDSTGTVKRAYCYKFPPLEICRMDFEKIVGIEIGWDQDEVFADGEFEI